MDMGIVVAALGWVGAGLSLAAYYCVSKMIVAPDSLKYQAMAVGGAVLLALACAWNAAWPSFVTNMIFVAVGVKVVMTTKRAIVKHLMQRAGQRALKAPRALTKSLKTSPAEIQLQNSNVVRGYSSSIGSVSGSHVVSAIPARCFS